MSPRDVCVRTLAVMSPHLDDPTLADAILDRVLHAAHKLPLAGESQRKPEKTPS